MQYTTSHIAHIYIYIYIAVINQEKVFTQNNYVQNLHSFYLVTVADNKQMNLIASKEKVQQLQAELDTHKRVSRAKYQQISYLEEKLKMLQQKGKQNDA